MADEIKLTPKQEKFCQSFIETENGSESYKKVYNVEKMSDGSVYVEVSRLFDNPKITLRLEQLRAKHAEDNSVTVKSLTDELEQARAVGKKEGQAGGMVSATMGKAKLHGLIMDRSHVETFNMTPEVVKDDIT